MMKFENQNVEIATINGELLFEIYSTGKALGYCRWNGKRTSCTPQKDRIDKVLKNAEIKPSIHYGRLYITESQLYDFMLEARTDKCRKFRKWVTNEVLPSIRKTGQYNAHKKEKNSKITPLMYKNNPVITIRDIYNNSRTEICTIRHYIRKCLICGTDYYLIQGEEMRDFKIRNIVNNSINMLIVITKTGLLKLSNILNFEISDEIEKIFDLKSENYNIKRKAIVSIFDELQEYNKDKAVIYLDSLIKEQKDNSKTANNIINSTILENDLLKQKKIRNKMILNGIKLLKENTTDEIKKNKECCKNTEEYKMMSCEAKMMLEEYYNSLINLSKKIS